MKKYTKIDFACSGCGQQFPDEQEAQSCCGEEKTHLKSACCGEDIVSGTLREYPLGGYTWYIEYEIPVCEDCGREVVEHVDLVDGEWVLS